MHFPQVTGLPEAAKPEIHVQLSSPIEEQTITKLFDPLNPSEEGSTIEFKGVDTSVATIVVKVTDADIALGTSAVHDVKSLTEMDVLGGVTKKVSDLEIAIVPDDGEIADPTDSTPTAAEEEEKEGEEDKNEIDQADMTEKELTSGAIESTETEDEFEDAKSEEDPKSDEEETAEVNAGDEADTNDASDVKPEAEEPKSEDNGSVINAEPDTEAADVADVVDPSDAKHNAEEEPKSEENDSEINAEPNNEAAEVADQEVAEVVDDQVAVEENADQEESKSESDNIGNAAETQEETPAGSNTEVSVLVPTCVVQMRVEFNASVKDQKDELYDLLNKASKRKAMAVDKLRKSAAALNRSKPAESTLTSKNDVKAVKAGFLNKKTVKKDMFLIRWYKKTLGPNSMVRRVFPIAKNYILFFGGVALMHFQGQQLSLPPPV